MTTSKVPDHVRLRADRHPLGIVGYVFFVVGSVAISIGVGVLIIGLLWRNEAALAAGVLTVVAAAIVGYYSRAARERAFDAAVAESDSA
jgi:hypothetical protein